ncbi:TonB-dependent receptor [Sphingomonas canadensis]|uniref:TonB-dependent receptor n=1 Tax=Sphingomonas canadensis TaxID=1219257 RepID=A0ABW3H8R1_9SPHN|nr:TonB-dependent receptor [Sphingomonas canadensis]MCW3837200.1 TonB-dependent receptor [Sphingomonas canadensis]
MKHALAAAGLLLAAPAFAQDPGETPAEITVTGRGLEAPPGEAAYAVAEIDRERLTGTASARLEDALRDVAGLAQFRRSDSRSAHPTSQGVTIRGLGGNASSRTLLLLDGVPQADPFGGWVAFPAYLPARLGSARVVRGGGSGYAGPGALAGTIELFSAGPEALGPLALSTAYGSRDSLDTVATASAALGPGFVTAAAQYARGDGFIPVIAEQRGPVDRASPYEQASLSLRAVIDTGGAEVQASLSGFTDRRERGVAFTAGKSEGADASLRIVGRGDWRWSALAYVQARGFSSGFASVDAARATVTPTLDQYSVPSTGTGGRIEIQPPAGDVLTLRLGADARAVSGRTQEYYTYVAGAPTRRREAGGRSATFGAFADVSVETGALTLSGGLRLDRWQIRGGRMTEAPLAGGALLTGLAFADRSGWEGTGRIGAAFDAGGGVALRAAGYRGWRLPTLNELYRPFRVGADATAANAALAPERLSGAEAGLDWSPAAGFTLRATGYWNRLDGAIANVTIASGPGSFPGVGFVSAAGVYRQRQNLDSVTAYGVEFDARLTRGDWYLAASWSLADARVAASGVPAPLDGLRPAQTARNQGSATLGWSRGGWAVSFTGRYTGAQFEDDQNLRLLNDAVTLDALLRVPLGAGLSFEARGENLFDARVEAGISGGGIVERSSPRTLWAGLRYALR